MAIKVISVDPSVYKRCTCKNCGSVLEYTPSDVQVKSVSDYTGSTEHYKCIECPVCGEQIYLRDNYGYY